MGRVLFLSEDVDAESVMVAPSARTPTGSTPSGASFAAWRALDSRALDTENL
jgi:hypothetical protein